MMCKNRRNSPKDQLFQSGKVDEAAGRKKKGARRWCRVKHVQSCMGESSGCERLSVLRLCGEGLYVTKLCWERLFVTKLRLKQLGGD